VSVSARASRALLLAVIGLSASVACSDDSSSSGALVIQLESDLAMPKDIDRVHLTASQGEQVLLDEFPYTGPDGLRLPTQRRLRWKGSAEPVLVRAVGYLSNQPRIERSVRVTIPHGSTRLLRLRLEYLCAGQVNPDETSSCGERQTCKQGGCESAELVADQLPLFDPNGTPDADGGRLGPPGGCFDVLVCFSDAAEVEVDAASCSFALVEDAPLDRLNVALKLPFDREGVCGAGDCWVALEPGEGWTLDRRRLQLPAAACMSEPGAPAPVVAISTRCLAMPPGTPPCGAWSSLDNRIDSAQMGDDDAEMLAPPRIRVGDACEGYAKQACGDCGTRSRTCVSGSWGDWSECTTEGVCSVAASQLCGEGGQQSCDSSCSWGECLDQACAGPATQACGNCGVQRRICSNGAWSDWGVCESEGACAPGTTQQCGSGGTQACGGNCQWGDCGEQRCVGAPSEACGSCGTRTRACDSASGEWGAWSSCSDEGECQPNAARDCGRSGTQVCAGNCQWDGACTGQSCAGSASRGCGNCGVQTRSCNMDTGDWSGWSECRGQGACAPSATRGCGASGTQECGANCAWEDACTGQVCEGAAARTCGRCGMQTRGCNGDTGQWFDWSSCQNQGSCAAGSTRSCGAGGTQRCGDDCQWQSACTGQVCEGAASRSCGNCGTQTRSCNSNTGGWSDWSACMNQGACAPNATRSCGAGGTQSCSTTCRWSTTCVGQVCTGPTTQSCGNCGAQSRTCDSDTAEWSNWSACGSQGSCMPGSTRRCGVNMSGSQTCGANCEWGAACTGQSCPGSASQVCGNCGMQTRTCNTDSGVWSGWSACTGQGCKPETTQTCGQGGRGEQTCSAMCEWSMCALPCEPQTRDCGNCGTQTRACNADGTLGAWSACTGQGCEPGETEMCTGGGTHTCNEMCKWGACCTPETRSCQGCGTQTRACNADGTLGGWSACVLPAGACTPGESDACGGGGTRICSDACDWGACCVPETRSCGKCGMQMRACQPNGTLGPWSACAGETGVCEPGDERACMGTGSQTCTSMCEWGGCGCVAPAEACGDACFDLSRDPKHCGSCTRACGEDQTCRDSECACAGQLKACGSACVDTNSDEAHCGDCDKRCGDGQSCEAGVCKCASGTACGSACADLNTDEKNCGLCGKSCADGQTCQSGVCCAMGLSVCDGECVDLKSDEGNCGKCGEGCPAGVSCEASSCGCASGTRCGDACVDLSSDEQNCGACGTDCAAGQTCQSSICCAAGLTACGGRCVDLASDEENCSACGEDCAAGETCEDKRCVAPAPNPDAGPTPEPDAGTAPDAGPMPGPEPMPDAGMPDAAAEPDAARAPQE
jgi:hypothetical protein